MASRAADAPFRSGRKRGALAILKATEQLMGQHGLDGVSIRQINLAAGMANNSAVTYHFGDKTGLLRAVLEWRRPALVEAARVEFDRVEAAGQLHDPGALFGIMMRPYLSVLDDEGRHSHAAFMQHIVRSREGRNLRVAMSHADDCALRAIDLLRQTLPELPSQLLSFRLRIATVAFFDALIEWDRGPVDPKFPQYTLEDLVQEMIGMAAANFARPAA